MNATSDAQINAVVGGNIRRLRTARGLTLGALAEKAQLDDSYLGKMERGLRGTTSGGYARLASALQVRIGTLFERPRRRARRPAVKPSPSAAA